MTLSSSALPGAGAGGDRVVGFDAGWQMVFRKDDGGGFPVDDDAVTFTRADYEAVDLQVEGDDSFRGATFEVAVDGMLDEDYAKLAKGRYMHVELWLGWRDLGRGVGQALKSAAALFTGGSDEPDDLFRVLEGRVYTAERSHGEFRYRTRFTGVDSRFHRMRVTAADIGKVDPGTALVGYAKKLCDLASVKVPVSGEGSARGIDGVLDVNPTAPVDEVLLKLSENAHGGAKGEKVTMFLREDGLHVGAWTAPVTGGNTWPLDLSTGLAEAHPVADTTADAPVLDPFEDETDRFDLLLLGRPEIQVGDLITAALGVTPANAVTSTVSTSLLGPLQDAVAGIAETAAAGDPQPYRVESVRHRLSLTEGFVTRLRVRSQPAGGAPEETEADASHGGDEAARLAALMEARSRRAALERRTTEVGLVARQTIESKEVDGRDVPAQRLVVHEGLVDAPPPNLAVLAGPATTPVVVVDKPYLTPFAFGNAGLVVPHYPGMRVLAAHYLENLQNAVVLGAVWPEGQEPKSELGDWWLCLPTGITAAESTERPADVTAPGGPGSHDLIDAEGARAIHVLGFRITVGKGHMPDIGVRPDPPPQNQLVIEHEQANAKIRIDGQGNIELSTDKDITLTANKIVMNVDDAVEIP
jgi:hypothetical protein